MQCIFINVVTLKFCYKMDRYHKLKSYSLGMQANNCKSMALRAPHDARVAMVFGFPALFDIGEFLQKINLPQLLSNVSHWRDLKFKFLVHGTDSRNYFVDKEVEVDFDLHNLHLAELAEKLHIAYQCVTMREAILESKVSRMYITC